jgi:outer membrane protein OmpA-like peptidoglycan-associated protein
MTYSWHDRKPRLSNPAKTRNDKAGGMQQRSISSDRRLSNQLTANLMQHPGQGRSLPDSTRRYFGARFNTGFEQVKVHTDTHADQMANRFDARALSVGQDIYFRKGRYAPESVSGRQLLAHELAHVAQRKISRHNVADGLQVTRPVHRAEQEAEHAGIAALGGGDIALQQSLPSNTIARSVDDPDRFATVHQNLFVDAPGVGSTARQPWQATTGAQIIQQFKTALQQLIDTNPMAVLGDLPQITSEAGAESTAIQVDQRIRTRFPQIGTPMTEPQIRNVVSLMTPVQTSNQTFIGQWLANRLFRETDIGDFAADENDANFQQVVTSLATDTAPFDFTAAFSTLISQLSAQNWSAQDIAITVGHERQRVNGFTWAQVIQVLAGRTGAFVDSGTEIFLSPGLSAAQRRITLIHELIHFNTDPRFDEWVGTTTAPRFYDEGFTEYLARRVMNAAELSGRDEYQDRVDAIEQEVAPYVSTDDIARAYFTGEVWRLETQSAVARRVFGEQTGLHAGSRRTTEVAESASSTGIVQTVEPGQRYRFMNLAVDSDQVKPEHEVALRQILTDHVLGNSSARIRFVGHASTPGSRSHNMDLSQRRAAAFYALAQQLGVPDVQLIDVAAPLGEGETNLNVTENSRVIERALNRRVEMTIE